MRALVLSVTLFKNNMKCFCIVFLLILSGCSANTESIRTEFLSDICIKPLIDYHYLTCNKIYFKIDGEQFEIPANFETDLASIPKIAWPIMAPAHSSLIRPAIVHDWFYRKTCDFTRFQTDIIFYHMLRNDGVSLFRASVMYYAVRLLGWNYYNEDYCDDELKGLDKEERGVQIASILGHSRKSDYRVGA